MQRAESLELGGKPAEAELIYRELLLSYPDHLGVLHNLALLLRERGEAGEAELLLRHALNLAPENPDLHNSYGALLHAGGFTAEAEICYRKALDAQPEHAEAHYNLGVLLEDAGRGEEALSAYRKSVALNPRYARPLTRIGALLSERGAHEEALIDLDRAVSVSPHFFDAQYYRGNVLSSLRRHDEALATLQRAATLRPDSFDAVLATANALRNAGRHDDALAAYWHAIELRPERTETHEQINRLAWSAGRRDLYLRSFGYARERLGATPDLLQCEAVIRLRGEDFGVAEELLWRARALAPERGDILGLLAMALSAQKRFEEAYAFFEDAITLEPQQMTHRHQLGFTLLRDGQAAEARHVLEQAHALDPQDQLVLAAKALAYRELGDSRYQPLMDLARYVRTYDIKPPSGFADVRSFNEALARELDALHTARKEPIDQTLRSGTQTPGYLFAERSPLIRELRGAIREAVADYIRDLPRDAAHPMSQRLSASDSGEFDFIGSWSCRLRTQGYHTNHVHPMGWISSAYYARLPQDIEQADRHSGWLKFGESNIALGEQDRPELFVKPQVGRLVLFPSFFWHGTVPFDDGNDRLSIAFDAVPGTVPAALLGSAYA
ncbi:MAG: tetratricopeptide repeat protein, partial [Nevskiales bacterium]